MNEIIDIYSNQIRKKKWEKDPKFKDWFRASSAGTCYRKQWYSLKEYEQEEMDDRVMRLLRLGTIVHADIENAIKEHCKDESYKPQIVTEKEITIPELKVVGHLDIAKIEDDGDSLAVHIYDVKTCASYKWRMKFGRKPETNPSFNYELQVGTYGLGCMAEYDTEDISLSILWYNKDTSAMRSVELDAMRWTDEALEYWTDLEGSIRNVTDAEELEPGVSFGVPMMNWECRYCNYTKYCGGI